MFWHAALYELKPSFAKGEFVWHCAFTQPRKVVIPNQIATTWSLGEHSGILITWHGRNIFWFVVCKGEKAMYIYFKSCFSFLALLYLLKHPPGQHHFPGSIMEMSSLEIELGPRERDPTQNGRKTMNIRCMTQRKTISLILLRSWKVMRWTQLSSDLYSKALKAFTWFRLLKPFVSYTFSLGERKKKKKGI